MHFAGHTAGEIRQQIERGAADILDRGSAAQRRVLLVPGIDRPCIRNPGAGIADARAILSWNQHNSPLRKTVTIDNVGSSALYLLSDLSAGVTGEIHHVDSGYNITSMPTLETLTRAEID